MTPSGWVAETAVAVARQKPPPRQRIAEAQLVELAAMRKQLVRVGTLLNQAVKATNATGELSPGLPYLCGRVAELLAQIDRSTAATLGRGR